MTKFPNAQMVMRSFGHSNINWSFVIRISSLALQERAKIINRLPPRLTDFKVAERNALLLLFAWQPECLRGFFQAFRSAAVEKPGQWDAAERPLWSVAPVGGIMALSTKSALAVALMGGLAAGTVVGVVGATRVGAASTTNVRNLDETWPNMRRALRDLHHARDSLAAAEDVFHGRREAAIGHTDDAIHEVEKALAEH
jgi:hypothetical protein